MEIAQTCRKYVAVAKNYIWISHSSAKIVTLSNRIYVKMGCSTEKNKYLNQIERLLFILFFQIIRS